MLAAPSGVIRGQLVRYLGMFAVLTVGAVFAVTLIGSGRAVERLSREVIDRTLVETHSELTHFFGPLNGLLLTARAWAPSGLLTDERVPDVFMPLIDRVPQMSSVIVADDTGRELMLLRRENSWTSRQTDLASGRSDSLFTEYDTAGVATSSERKDVGYDPRTRPWFEVAHADGYDERVYWTEPYTFFTTGEAGITASVRWQDEPDGPIRVLAFDLLLESVCRFTTHLDVSERGRAIILTDDGRTLGVPREDKFASEEQFKAALLQPVESLGVTCATAAMEAWDEHRVSGDSIVRFESEGEQWWAGFRPYSLSPEQQLWIAVVVPEADLLGDNPARHRQILAIGLIAVVASLVLAWVLDRSIKRRVLTAVQHAKQLGQYEVESKIGDGGMGAVYRATHTMLRRPTALKLLHADQAGSEHALRRFEREVRITSELTHPNTIAIFDYGRTPDGVFYYAMEYLEGITFEDLARECGAQPPERVIHLLLQACGSLAEAHEHNLVHRDVKPANLMLCERGGMKDVVKVLDFGLVKLVQSADVSQTANVVSGTPLYMAPEAITKPDEIDARTDLYALGAIGYLLLTGTVVFDVRNTMLLFQKQVREAPERPSKRLGKPLPTDLEDVILSCLKKRPDHRPSTARDVANALSRCADAGKWSQANAVAWWEEHGKGVQSRVANDAGSGLQPGPLTIDLRSRDAEKSDG